MSARARFRQLLREPGIIVMPAIYDPLGARIAEESGLSALALGGYAMGAHLMTSEPLVSLDEVARISRSIGLVCKLPILVDAGAGYGEPMHVMHTVSVLEQAGVAALHLEDQAYPKRASYHKGIEEIISTEEMVMKIRAALKARIDPELLIAVRTDAMRTHDYDEGIRRARLFVEAGAEMIIIFPNSEEETRQAPKDLPGVPLLYVNSTGNKFGRPLHPAPQLEAWGWKIAYEAISTVNVTARAVRTLMQTLKSTGAAGLDPTEITAVRGELERTIRLHELYKIEEETVR